MLLARFEASRRQTPIRTLRLSSRCPRSCLLHMADVSHVSGLYLGSHSGHKHTNFKGFACRSPSPRSTLLHSKEPPIFRSLRCCPRQPGIQTRLSLLLSSLLPCSVRCRLSWANGRLLAGSNSMMNLVFRCASIHEALSSRHVAPRTRIAGRESWSRANRNSDMIWGESGEIRTCFPNNSSPSPVADTQYTAIHRSGWAWQLIPESLATGPQTRR